MAYIAPNSTIKFLKNVPLDNSYEHTIYFASLADQTRYFSSASLVKYTLTEQSYQRVKRGYIRVEIPSDNLYDCNYIAFQNTNFGNKWFYAFVRSVEYINNAVSEIEFEIDVLQTWHFDYQLGRCFVLRSHTTTDVIGENIEPEPVDIGEYVCNGSYTNLFADLSNLIIILGVIDLSEDDEVETENTQGKIYDGIYGGLTLYWYKTSSSGIALLNEKLGSYIQQPENVVALYVVPQYLVGEALITTDQSGVINSGSSGTQMTATFGSVNSSTTLDGYYGTDNTGIRNKKLLTYPYNFYHVDNGNGSSLSLRYEFFTNLTIALQLNGTFTQPCKITVRPFNYKGTGNGVTLNTEVLTLSDFPLCSWNMDAYNAWVAQNSIPTLTNVLTKLGLGGAGVLSSFLTGNPIGAIAGVSTAFSAISDALTQNYKASIASDISGGNFNSGNVNVSAGKQNFYGGRFSVNYSYARKIDDFFSMYGYAINKLIAPDRVARPYWTYLKLGTVELLGTSGVPSDDSEKIVNIYKNGITWWKYFTTTNTAYVGRYDLDNRV